MYKCYDHGGHGFQSDCIECNRVEAIKTENKKLRDALEWIQVACKTDTNSCICGRPTGVLAVYNYAKRALEK